MLESASKDERRMGLFFLGTIQQRLKAVHRTAHQFMWSLNSTKVIRVSTVCSTWAAAGNAPAGVQASSSAAGGVARDQKCAGRRAQHRTRSAGASEVFVPMAYAALDQMSSMVSTCAIFLKYLRGVWSREESASSQVDTITMDTRAYRARAGSCAQGKPHVLPAVVAAGQPAAAGERVDVVLEVADLGALEP